MTTLLAVSHKLLTEYWVDIRPEASPIRGTSYSRASGLQDLELLNLETWGRRDFLTSTRQNATLGPWQFGTSELGKLRHFETLRLWDLGSLIL